MTKLLKKLGNFTWDSNCQLGPALEMVVPGCTDSDTQTPLAQHPIELKSVGDLL